MNLLYNRIPRIQQALKPLKLSGLRAFFKNIFLLVFLFIFSPQINLNIISYLYKAVLVIKIPSHGNRKESN